MGKTTKKKVTVVGFDDWAKAKKAKFGVIAGRDQIKDFNAVKTWIPTGIFPLDLAIGGRGIPSGKVILLSSDPSQGKTLLALYLLKAVQEAGGCVHLIETEGSLDTDWAEALGVSFEKPYAYQCPAKTLEDVYEYMNWACQFHNETNPDQPVLIYWDSISMTPPGKLLLREFPDILKDAPLAARYHRNALLKLETEMRRSNISLIAISQLTQKVSMTGQPMVGDTQQTTGGTAWGFYNSLHLRLKPASGQNSIYTYKDAKKGDRVHEQGGVQLEIFVKKSKIGAPFRKAFIPVYFEAVGGHDIGIDAQEADLIWLKDRKMIGNYTGPDKTLSKAKAKQIRLPSGNYPFIGVSGWKRLLADTARLEEIHQLMLDNKTTRGDRDPEEGKASDAAVTSTSLSGEEIEDLETESDIRSLETDDLPGSLE